MTIPLCDLGLGREIAFPMMNDLWKLIASGQFIGGPVVEEFEDEWARYCGRKYCVGVSSGTDALRIALMATVPQDHHVIVPAMTFAATYEAVIQADCVPVPVDVREDGTIDPELVEAAVLDNELISAVIPVHLYGRLADMEALNDVSSRYGLTIIEDACQSHGARPQVAGLAAAYSFYPSKNLGAIGDAGAIVTDEESIHIVARALRQHGAVYQYDHNLVGYTARLDAVQAVALLHKLRLLDRGNIARARAAQFYAEHLADIEGLRLPPGGPHSENVWHVYVIRTADPAGLAEWLVEAGIQTGCHYPVPPPLAKAYTFLGYQAGAFPQAELLASECLSLPLWPGITEDQQWHVVEHVRTWFA